MDLTEATEDWRKLDEEKLHDLCCSRNIVTVIKSRRMGWMGICSTEFELEEEEEEEEEDDDDDDDVQNYPQ